MPRTFYFPATGCGVCLSFLPRGLGCAAYFLLPRGRGGVCLSFLPRGLGFAVLFFFPAAGCFCGLVVVPRGVGSSVIKQRFREMFRRASLAQHDKKKKKGVIPSETRESRGNEPFGLYS